MIQGKEGFMEGMHTVERTPLANNWNDRRTDGYDVVVIGSGYGGAITAARVASAEWDGEKPSVCVLERGREWLPGQFPDQLEEGPEALRSPLNPLGLHEIHLGSDISIWQGSGLGGTSLVNANVAIEPDSEVFDNPRWPEAIRDFHANGMPDYFERVRQTLGAGRHPLGAELSKVKALEQGQRGVAGADFDVAKIAVNFADDPENRWGVRQQPCINCGDCVTGCNVGAKNTLDTNYLKIAKSGGAHLFPQVEVERIEKDSVNGGYRVVCNRRENNSAASVEVAVPARRVVLAAGSPGSATLLLRSQEQGLDLPDTLGSRFSGNGDFFGVAYNSDVQTDALGWGAFPDSDVARRMQPDDGPERRHPGPTIVARIKYNTDEPLDQRITIEDVSFPRTYVDAARRVFPALPGVDTDFGIMDELKELGRVGIDILGLRRPIAEGALNHTLMYLVMGQDDANGRIRLKHGATKIEWDGAGGQPTFRIANELMKAHATKLGAKFIESPAWAFLRAETLITVHPLGGCPMGETGATGLVNDAGQVYNGSGGKHAGLYVADASIVPTSIGVNPFLTISALAERIAEKLIQEMGGRPRLVAPPASAP